MTSRYARRSKDEFHKQLEKFAQEQIDEACRMPESQPVGAPWNEDEWDGFDPLDYIFEPWYDEVFNDNWDEDWDDEEGLHESPCEDWHEDDDYANDDDDWDPKDKQIRDLRNEINLLKAEIKRLKDQCRGSVAER